MAGPLRYPKEALHDTTDYLRIDAYSYSPIGTGLTRSSTAISGDVLQDKKYKELKNSIILPIPSNIQDGNSVSYADSSLDGLTAQIYNAVNPGFGAQSLNAIPAALSNVLSRTTQVLTDPDAIKLFNKTIAAQAANIPFGGNLTVSQILARESGEILNPNMELLFNGVTLRSFKFSFKMTPRFGDEAKEIRKIIQTLKTFMAPGGEYGTFLKTPAVFQLSYRKGPEIHPYLNLFKLCFLTDMSVNYTGEGTYATYGDGSPISYVMDLSFKEIEPIYSGDYTKIVDEIDKTTGF